METTETLIDLLHWQSPFVTVHYEPPIVALTISDNISMQALDEWHLAVLHTYDVWAACASEIPCLMMLFYPNSTLSFNAYSIAISRQLLAERSTHLGAPRAADRLAIVG